MPHVPEPLPYYLLLKPASPSPEALNISEDVLQECADALWHNYTSSSSDNVAADNTSNASDSPAIDGWADILTLEYPAPDRLEHEPQVVETTSELTHNTPANLMQTIPTLPAIVTAPPASPTSTYARDDVAKQCTHTKPKRYTLKPYDYQPQWRIDSHHTEKQSSKQPREELQQVIRNMIPAPKRFQEHISPQTTVADIRHHIRYGDVTVEEFTALMTERKLSPRIITSFVRALPEKNKDTFIESVIERLKLVGPDKLYPPYTHEQYIQVLQPEPLPTYPQEQPRDIRKKQLAHIQAHNNSLDVHMIATFAATQPSPSIFKRYLHDIKLHLSPKQCAELFDYYAKNPLKQAPLQKSLNRLINK